MSLPHSAIVRSRLRRDEIDPDIWDQIDKPTADDASVDDYFGTSVSISGDTVVVGASNDDDAGSNSGSAYVYDRSCDIGCCDGAGTGDAAKTFCISGTSNEVGYSWRLTGPSFALEELNAPAVAAGSDAEALAAAFVDSINSVGCANKASVQLASPQCFTVTICGDASFDLTVGPVGNPDVCCVTCPANVDGCSYNPTITEVITAIPTVSEWGMVVMALLILLTGTVVYAQWRPVVQA